MTKRISIGALSYLIPTFAIAMLWHLVASKATTTSSPSTARTSSSRSGSCRFPYKALLFAWIDDGVFAARKKRWLSAAPPKKLSSGVECATSLAADEIVFLPGDLKSASTAARARLILIVVVRKDVPKAVGHLGCGAIPRMSAEPVASSSIFPITVRHRRRRRVATTRRVST